MGVGGFSGCAPAPDTPNHSGGHPQSFGKIDTQVCVFQRSVSFKHHLPEIKAELWSFGSIVFCGHELHLSEWHGIDPQRERVALIIE